MMPSEAINRIKRRLATPFMRRLLRRPIYVRETLARRYLRGEGIEVGAFNAPLLLPAGATARYVDHKPLDPSADFPVLQAPDIISDLESLAGIGDESVDFIIANHVLEHVENPLRALKTMARVLRRGGIAFIALPDKRFSFDKRRPLTDLAHIVRDYREGPGWSRHGHYVDWVRNVEALAGEQAGSRVGVMEREVENIHFHVWDHRSMKRFFRYACSLPEIHFAVCEGRWNRNEVIWLLRKS